MEIQQKAKILYLLHPLHRKYWNKKGKSRQELRQDKTIQALSPRVLIFLMFSNSFVFPIYGNKQVVIVTLHVHTSFAQFGTTSSLIRIPSSSIYQQDTIAHLPFIFPCWKSKNLSSSEASLKKLSSSNCTFWGVTITSCSFQHIGKSKELNYVRKISAWGDKWFKSPTIDVELIVRPISMISHLNTTYCNNKNGYFVPLRCLGIINT